jgi:ATP-dependent Lhr-like helicase
LTNVYEGSTFILHGRPWRVVKIEEDSILVSPIREIGRIPSWVGEDIPVPFEVAEEVGALRRKEELIGYPCNRDDTLVKCDKGDFAIPSDRQITIDVGDKFVVINSCFGTRVNETIGRILSSLLAYRVGESVRMGSDPYRILLEFSRRVSADDIEETLRSIDPESVEHLLRKILKNSSFIKWYLIHTARKFGAISEDYSSIGTKRLFELFDSTMIMEETLQRIIWERMDVENAKKVLSKIREGTIRIVKQGLSPFSKSFEISRGLMLPDRPERAILEAIEKRIQEKSILLVCLNCLYKWRTRIKRVELKPRCSRCGALRIAVASEEDLSFLTGKKADDKRIRKLSTAASLVLSYGKFALITLAGRGIGAKTAARILRNYRFYELKTFGEKRRELLRDIWKAEIQYAQTRGFWER